jgi:hypothetical protein
MEHIIYLGTEIGRIGDQMDERYWFRFLPWRQKSKPDSISAQIKFTPQLQITRQDGWTYLELLLVNRSNWTVWVEEATVVLDDLDANSQTGVPTGQADHKIRQNVVPGDALSVSLAAAIYDAAGRPQGPYSGLILTNVRYRVFDECCNAQLETCRVEMRALTVLGLRRERWYSRKIKQIKGRCDLTAQQHKG